MNNIDFILVGQSWFSAEIDFKERNNKIPLIHVRILSSIGINNHKGFRLIRRLK